MKNKRSVSWIVVIVLLTTLGCSVINEVKKGIETPEVVFGRDGKAQLTTPGTWTEVEEKSRIKL